MGSKSLGKWAVVVLCAWAASGARAAADEKKDDYAAVLQALPQSRHGLADIVQEVVSKANGALLAARFEAADGKLSVVVVTAQKGLGTDAEQNVFQEWIGRPEGDTWVAQGRAVTDAAAAARAARQLTLLSLSSNSIRDILKMAEKDQPGTAVSVGPVVRDRKAQVVVLVAADKKVVELRYDLLTGERLGAADARRASTFTGRVEAAEQTGMYAHIVGAVEKVHVDIGDRVKKGQVLIELSAPELKDEARQEDARVAQAEAEVEPACQGLLADKARLTLADAELEAARAGVKRARAAYEFAKAQADRMEELERQKAIDRETVDERRRQAEAAKAAVEEAEAKVKAAEATRDVGAAQVGKAEAEVKAAGARVDAAKAGAQRVQTLLGYSKITAPFDGVVTRRLIDTGAFVGPPKVGETAPLLVVARDDVVHIVFDVDERSATHLAVGAAAVIRLPALEGVQFEGKVTRMAGAFDPNTGTLRAEVDLPNPEGKLRPGMFVTVEAAGNDSGR